MDTFVNAIVPVFGVILIGALFKLYAFPGDTFWPMAARITYFALFPALLVNRLARSHLAGLAIGPLALGIAVPIMIITLILVVIRPQLRMTNAAFTSVFQGSIRFNTYVAGSRVSPLWQCGTDTGSGGDGDPDPAGQHLERDCTHLLWRCQHNELARHARFFSA